MKIPICRFKTIPNNQNYPFDIIFIHIFTLSAQNFPSFEDTNPIFVGSISSFAPEIQFFLVASPSCCLSQFLPLVHPDFCVFFFELYKSIKWSKKPDSQFFTWLCLNMLYLEYPPNLFKNRFISLSSENCPEIASLTSQSWTSAIQAYRLLGQCYEAEHARPVTPVAPSVSRWVQKKTMGFYV